MRRSQLPQWQALVQHRQQWQATLCQLFDQDSQRASYYQVDLEGLVVNYSRSHATQQTWQLLFDYAKACDLPQWVERSFTGEAINHTEQRAVLHTALRNPSSPVKVAGQGVASQVEEELRRMADFVEAVRSGQWRGYTGQPIRHVVNIGIGGSDLGPKMVCEALANQSDSPLTVDFLSSVDDVMVEDVLSRCCPETTLFIVASKSFSTQETMTNAHSARRWLIEALGDEQAVAKHFVALSTQHERVQAFGIDLAQCFGFWDWVGGRYSLWSVIGLPVALLTGMISFRELLAGAHAMDEHFRYAPWAENAPVILALLGFWYRNFFHASSHGVLVYDQRLQSLMPYLQQLDMESNGKSVDRDGQAVDYATGPVIWGGVGINGQHAFYQLLHQGTDLIPCDFIATACASTDYDEHHRILLANALAQSAALMQGKGRQQVIQELEHLSPEQREQLLPYKQFPGNRPSNTLLLERLTPHRLGQLIALYEHKVFVQGILWNINSFDQWGVELGKQLANQVLPQLKNSNHQQGVDSITQQMIKKIQQWQGNK